MVENAKILVIDDDESIRHTMKAILEHEGYRVECAINGKEALAKTKVNSYDLALIDIRLPDMEGTELLAKMNKTTSGMVKFFVTGFPSVKNAMDAVNLGADGYFLKPIEFDKFLDRIKTELKKKKEAKDFDESKIADFIKTRVKELINVEK